MEKHMYDKNREVLESLRMPTYDDMKAAFINAIKEVGISDSEEYLLDEVFNPDSKLYEYSVGAIYDQNEDETEREDLDIELIMLNINEDFFGNHNLFTEVQTNIGIACDLIAKRNPACEELSNGKCMEFLDENGYSHMYEKISEDFWDRFLEETTVETFKELILKIKRDEI